MFKKFNDLMDRKGLTGRDLTLAFLAMLPMVFFTGILIAGFVGSLLQ